ncbi:Dehydrodolichyl diphosphate synthase complex subunit NUS1 [Beauveria bassiana]|nr:Dehydrodolichyl diphosphate synthase complex subunit NUS1 [Beauveria bassiana]
MVSALSKTPNHLSAIFDVGVSTDDMNLEKVIQQAAELAAWSVAAGIPTISIYDARVYLNGRRLLEDDDTNPDGEQPGHSLYLISENDGQRALRSITEALTERVKHGDMTIDDISVDLVAEQLHLLVMPAPDLIVVFGSELNLSGYPLWHLQQAELETLYNEDEFGFLAFAHALQSYAGAEMRYGK